MWGESEIGMNGGVCKILCYFSRFWQIVDIGAFRPVLHLNFLLTYVQKNLAKNMFCRKMFYMEFFWNPKCIGARSFKS